MPMAEYWTRHALPSARRAVESTGLFNAHSAGTQCFEQLFPGFAPTPLQHHCDSVTPADGSQLYILEDATGAGKTEAAMTLVHRLMQTTGASGVYVGLPSMATANAMYSRMVGVYRSLFSESSSPSLVLSHGARHLSEDFQQALFNALPANASYGAGHVLVLDEVHAYDHYTRELLYRLLAFHAALGGSTVLLSATLTAAQKVAMARAVSGSRGRFAIDRDAPYPLVTHVSADGLAQHPVATRPEVTREVRVVFVHSVDTALEQVVAAAAHGACVCWVRNTVDEARAAWQALLGVAGVDTGRLHLFHSRFAFADRLAIEMQLQGWFGPDSNADDRRGRILVATQVVEQSLDLDFDHFLSDLAPIDLLVQRAGRLQRHTRSLDGDRAPREARDTAQLTVLAPPWTDTPDEHWLAGFSRGSHAVYPETHVLWQSAQWLRVHGGWRMPGDARALLEHAYATDNLPPGLQDVQLKSEGEAKGQRDMGQWSALTFGAGYCRTSAWDEGVGMVRRSGRGAATRRTPGT